MTVDEKDQTEITTSFTPPEEPEQKGISPFVYITLGLLAIVLGVVIYRGIHSRANANVALQRDTQESAISTVVVTYPQQSPAAEEILLPGNTQAFTDTPIYARTNGYLRRWYFDIG